MSAELSSKIILCNHSCLVQSVASCPSIFATIFFLAFCASAQAGAIAHWSFDDPIAYTDSSNGAHRFKIVSAPDHISSGQQFGGGALRFNGSEMNELVLRGNNQGGALGLEQRSFTISFWLKRGSLGEQWVLTQGEESSLPAPRDNKVLHVGFRGFEFPDDRANGVTLAFYSNDLTHRRTPNDLDKWHHYVFIYDYAKGTQRVIVDGNIESSSIKTNRSEPIYANPYGNDLYIGSRHGKGVWFDGFLDELWFFDHALSDEEVGNLYAHNDIHGHKVEIPEPSSFGGIVSLFLAGWVFTRRRFR